MSRSIRACVLLALLVVAALFPPILVAQQAPPLDADDRAYPWPFLPDNPVEQPAPPQSRAATMSISWSRIVYYARGGGDWDLFLSDDIGINAVRLTSGKNVEVDPDLNRGGTHVVYASNADGDFDLYVMRLSDGATARLLDTPADEGMPVWSADGGRVAFQSDLDGQPEVYVIDGGGGNLTRLTTNPDFDGHPSWSPDGLHLAFSSRRNGQYRVWTMNADGSGQTQLSNQPGGLYPAWSPGGGEIFYSADANNDGWLDLWRMTSNGANQNIVMVGGATVDLMARSWSPDGLMVSYTHVAYIAYQGQWYINYTYIMRTDLDSPSGENIVTPVQYPFSPGWQTLDNIAPVSAIAPLPATSPGPITINWSLADEGPSGLREYLIQVKTGDGPWTDWLKNPPGTQAQFDATGGKTYSFRSRAVDLAVNTEPWPAAPEAVTTVEALPPVTSLAPLPAYSRADESFDLSRSGYDPGRSGISGYLLQWRRNGGPWADWPGEWEVNQTTFDPAALGVAPGDKIDFRLRGTDAAHNVEPWPADPDASTTLYSWGVSGRVTDNTGTPVGGAAVTAAPAMLGPSATGPDGDFGRYMGGPGIAATLGWAKPGYGGIPATTFAPGPDVALDVALPPVGDAVAGGDFEAAGWGAWQTGGSLTPALSAGARHTGAQGALLAPRPPLFGPPYRLSANGEIVENDVRVSVHAGAATVVWQSGEEMSKSLWAARRGADGAWSPPVTVLSSVGYGYDLATGPDGRLHLVARGAGGLVYLRPTGDLTWAAPESIPGSSPAQELQLLRGPDGALHLFWVEWVDRGTNLRYSRRAPSGGWSAPVAVAAIVEGSLMHYGAAMTPDGGLHVAYYATYYEDDEGDQLWVRSRLPNGTWTAAAMVQQGERLQLYWAGLPVAGPDGRVHLTWNWIVRGDSSTRFDVYYAVKNGPAWSAAQRIFMDADVAALAAGPDGAVHALISRFGLVSYTRLSGGLWAAPQPVPGSTGGTIKLLIDGDGLPHVLRGGYGGDYSSGDLQYTRRLPSGVWTAPVSVATEFNNNYRPDAVLDGGGNVHVAWLVEDANTSPTRPDVAYAGPVPGNAGEATLSQTVAVPDVAHPVLSFFYSFGGGATAATRFEVTTGDAPARTLPPAVGVDGAARHYWLDLAGYAGQTVDVTFRLVQAAGEPAAWAAVDDVSLGAAAGDVWLTGAGGSALPGRTTVIELRAGNRGGVAAAGVALTLTLPPELTFVSAVPAPDATGPLRWELGTLSPDQAQTIRVTVAVKPSAKPFSTVTAAAEAVFPGELETHNNAVDVLTRLASDIYLPVSAGE